MKVYRILGMEGRITIPFAMRQAVGFQPQDLVSFELADRDGVLIRREILPEKKEEPIPKAPDFLVFLENLSEREQYQALVHLSVLWAERQGKPPQEGGT